MHISSCRQLISASIGTEGDTPVVFGRLLFARGCTGTSLLGVGISMPDDAGGLPRAAVVPTASMRIEET